MNWRRWTLCIVAPGGHKWTNLPYSQGEDTGFFQRCLRCGHENHSGASVRPTAL
ncbi:hypothetical protein ACT8ZV_13365 [Nocardioides sp. MAHUQ-72]|uniref:hypothetical protein n=1 Tax=unclassified Nocardioides TaxID=2615069 RepID=UPI0036164267